MSSNDEVKIIDNENVSVIPAPIFLLYAEYLGYVSPLIEWAEDWCYDAKKTENWKKNVIRCEANHIFKKVMEEYTTKELRGYYDEYYPVVFKFYEECLNLNN